MSGLILPNPLFKTSQAEKDLRVREFDLADLEKDDE